MEPQPWRRQLLRSHRRGMRGVCGGRRAAAPLPRQGGLEEGWRARRGLGGVGREAGSNFVGLTCSGGGAAGMDSSRAGPDRPAGEAGTAPQGEPVCRQRGRGQGGRGRPGRGGGGEAESPRAGRARRAGRTKGKGSGVGREETRDMGEGIDQGGERGWGGMGQEVGAGEGVTGPGRGLSGG